MYSLMIGQSLENVDIDILALSNTLHLKYRKNLFKLFVRRAKYWNTKYNNKTHEEEEVQSCIL